MNKLEAQHVKRELESSLIKGDYEQVKCMFDKSIYYLRRGEVMKEIREHNYGVHYWEKMSNLIDENRNLYTDKQIEELKLYAGMQINSLKELIEEKESVSLQLKNLIELGRRGN